GPFYDGISRETGFADTWPEAGLQPLWTRPIGIGFISVAVVGKRLLTMGHIDGQEHVWCLEADTGAVLWQHVYPSPLNDNLHEGGPCSTPTVDGERVFTLGKAGQLFCLALTDGRVLWQQ